MNSERTGVPPPGRPAPALNVALTDVLPSTVSYASVMSTQGTCAGGKTVNCRIGTLEAGQSATVTLKVNRVSKLAIVNAVTVAASTFDIVLGNNTATVQ